MDPIILLLRIIVPLSIFRFPLAGGLVSMLLVWINRFLQRREVSWSKHVVFFSVIIMTIPKIIQEWAMHIAAPANWRFVQVDIFHRIHFSYDTIGTQFVIGAALMFYIYFAT